ncbi:hypothetical protein [Deinococcus aquiradiocola]|uniref:DUF3017 domain-containing protein n=1 Tax=Deinococcus aquiradiocola TaxID=393059 RepID=A0A917P606_9DEIO|nr:hypothetical protein [Deinococcus aquiradiocola]GGJ63054.1 hypothetical protein GCM10008939_03630 [Deinococcus aquiradiocola]
MTRPPARPGPDLPTVLSLGLLGLIGVLLILPLLGVARPPVWMVAALLAARVGVQVWRARRSSQAWRPGSVMLDLVLIALLVWVGTGHG